MGSSPRARLAPVRRATALTLLVAVLVLFLPAIAWADEGAAEQLFQEGLAAMKRNDFPVACEAFLGSNKADPSPGTQINLAVCFEKRKMWASAWTWYRSAVGLAQQRGQKEREQLAEDAANRLKPQLHYVIISVKEPLNGMVVKRDGNEVTIAVAGKEVPLPFDPGEHSIEVSATGKKAWQKTIVIPDNGQTERVEVPKLVDAPVEQAGPAAGGVNYTPVVVTNDGSSQRTVGIIVGAAGILTGLAAGGLYILARSEDDEAKSQRGRLPTLTGPDREAALRSEKSHADAAENNQLLALILGGGAVVLVGVGVVLYVTAPKGSGKTGKPLVTPLLGPSFAGLGFSKSF